MPNQTVLITGSAGLIGSEAVRLFDAGGFRVHGVDNNLRARFFGADGDTSWNLESLLSQTKHFMNHNIDIRDSASVEDLVKTVRPDRLIHCAAQPAHELARKEPATDFRVNVAGTLHLLEACRKYTPEAPFVFCSSSKVYGPVNDIPYVETDSRFDFAVEAFSHTGLETPEPRCGGSPPAAPADHHTTRREAGHCERGPEEARTRLVPGLAKSELSTSCGGWSWAGINERFPLEPGDGRGIYGTGKAAADLFVQEYGISYGMRTVCLRGNCMTGSGHSPAELHGFLAYMARCLMEGRPYTVFGYQGKQVRDIIHSYDFVTAIYMICANPPAPGTVYNLGGGRQNSVSILEAIRRLRELSGLTLETRFADLPRHGDHRVYLSDTSKFRADYPAWGIKWGVDEMCLDLITRFSGSASSVAA
ncbi:MAG: NAD-dependent epimerase/dehydratase family protein [Thermodesulfobacteriota bacterium]